MDEKLQYIQLINRLNRIIGEINNISSAVRQYEKFIDAGIVANDSVGFKTQLSSFKELLENKKKKLKYEIIPVVKDCMRASRS